MISLLTKVLKPSDANYSEFILRSMLAFVMIFHGVAKVQAPFALGGFIGATMPFTASPIFGELTIAQLLSFLASWTELLGGLALMIGFATRLASLALAFIMFNVIFMVMGVSKGFDMLQGGLEYQWVLMFAYAMYAVQGAGKLSIDALLYKRLIGEKA